VCWNSLLVLRAPARPLLAFLALAAASLVPATAQAAVSITSVQLQPSTTAAGAHPDLTIDTKFDENPQSDDVKSLGVVLPQGLIANPASADRCNQSDFGADSCPAGSKVGSAQVSEVVTVAGVDMPMTASGDVYVLDPQGSEPARLGLVARSSGAVPLPKVFLQSGVTIGPATNYGIATNFDNIPRRVGGFDIRITEAKLTLSGTAAHGPFMTNPTDCRIATMTATATAYDQPGTATGSASFTPTACDQLPFAPQLSGTVGGVGLTGPGKAPPFAVTISMPSGQANISSVSLTLPPVLGPNGSQLGRACPVSDFNAGNCAAAARVGTAFATSGALPQLLGPVLLIAPSSGPLPQLAIQLGGLVPLSLVGDIGLQNGSVTNTFSGLPDLPLSTFKIALDASPGLLTNLADLCAPGAGTTLQGSMTAHSGRSASVTGPLAVTGCVPGNPTAIAKPLASLSIRFGSRGGVLTGHFKAGRGLPLLRRAQVKLPTGLKGQRRQAAVTVARRLGRSAVRLRGRVLDARLGKKGVKRVSLRWRGIHASRKLTQALGRRPRLTFVVLLTDVSGHTTKLPVAVRPVVAARP
jgi:hypothetical protein